jgi:three-Cys-motif partner protein
MSAKGDFHSSPFDEETNTKLRLFEKYYREWLAVFTSNKLSGVQVNIVDFLAGPGQDKEGNSGSPLVALSVVREFAQQILANGQTVRLYFNDSAKKKAKELKNRLSALQISEDLCKWKVYNLEFKDAFATLREKFLSSSNLLIFDQTGIKHITEEVFSSLLEIERTDFIFFFASSTIWRFADVPHMKAHIHVPKGEMSTQRFYDIHRKVADLYRGFIPSEKEFYIGSFSIKKQGNLYGVVFGSAHPLGMEKFVKCCWAEDEVTGEANFDIDDDRIDSDRPWLFPEMNRSNKLNVFRDELKSRIIAGQIKTDREVYLYALQAGCLPCHAREVLRGLKRNGEITMSVDGQQPRVSLDGYKEPRCFEVARSGSFRD